MWAAIAAAACARARTFCARHSIGRGSLYGERLQRSAPWRRVTPGRFDSSVHGVNLGTHTYILNK